MSDDMKPCPFCGSQPTPSDIGAQGLATGPWWCVQCPSLDCEAGGPMVRTPEEARRLWDARANALPSYEEAVEHCYVRGFFVTPLTLDWRGVHAAMADGKTTPDDLIALAVVMRGRVQNLLGNERT